MATIKKRVYNNNAKCSLATIYKLKKTCSWKIIKFSEIQGRGREGEREKKVLSPFHVYTALIFKDYRTVLFSRKMFENLKISFSSSICHISVQTWCKIHKGCKIPFNVFKMFFTLEKKEENERKRRKNFFLWDRISLVIFFFTISTGL